MFAQQTAFNIKRANPEVSLVTLQKHCNYINWKNQYKPIEHMQGYAIS